MRQQQKTREAPRIISAHDEQAAKFEYLMASAKAAGICFLVFGILVATLIHYHIPPYRKFFWLDDLGKLAGIPTLSMLIGHLYGRWVCRKKGISLERQESATWQRKPTEPMEKMTTFGLGFAHSLNRIAGALGVLLFLAFLALLIWGLTRGGFSPQPNLPLVKYVLGAILITGFLGVTFAMLAAGLLMSLAALRSGGELVRVDSEGISWVRGGVRRHVLWAKLSRAEVTRGYDVKGELANLEIRFFDNEDESQGVIAFGAERPKSMSPTTQSWPEQLEDFHDQFRNAFDTPR